MVFPNLTAKAKLSRHPCLAPFAAYLRHAKWGGVVKQGLKPYLLYAFLPQRRGGAEEPPKLPKIPFSIKLFTMKNMKSTKKKRHQDV